MWPTCCLFRLQTRERRRAISFVRCFSNFQGPLFATSFRVRHARALSPTKKDTTQYAFQFLLLVLDIIFPIIWVLKGNEYLQLIKYQLSVNEFRKRCSLTGSSFQVYIRFNLYVSITSPQKRIINCMGWSSTNIQFKLDWTDILGSLQLLLDQIVGHHEETLFLLAISFAFDIIFESIKIKSPEILAHLGQSGFVGHSIKISNIAFREKNRQVFLV